MSGESIRLSMILRLPTDFFHVMYIKDKKMMVFNFIFDLKKTGRGLLNTFCSFWGVPSVKID